MVEASNSAGGSQLGGRSALALELSGISKSFGLIKANQDIDLAVNTGSIHGIIGENGAGKSTLMKILYGMQRADRGWIKVGGNKADISSSAQAISLGIGMVHQHFMLVPTFTVLENVMLGSEGGSLLAKSRDETQALLARFDKEYGLALDPDTLVADLPVGLKQRVEIIKALKGGAEILILDEPTGVLTPQETESLFEILKVLKASGVTVLLITHKLDEIMAITDQVSIMRRGKMVGHRKTADTNPQELAELMVGRPVLLQVERGAADPGAVRLSTSQLSYENEAGVKVLKDLSFELRAGEILGVAGVSGNGQAELLEVLAGMTTASAGNFTALGQTFQAKPSSDGSGNVFRVLRLLIRPLVGLFQVLVSLFTRRSSGPDEMRKIGLGHIPEDRHKHGLVLDFKAQENLILGFHSHHYSPYGPLMKTGSIEAQGKALIQQYDIRGGGLNAKARSFSGGNQQKIVIAREIDTTPEVLLIGQPTRGVDVGAIEFIHKQIIALRDQGSAILLVSVELEEILNLSDRIMVMNDGMIMGTLERAEANEKNIGLLMAGIRDEQREQAA